jgi:hypothetical protein
MGRELVEETLMTQRSIKKLVREGEYVAEVRVSLLDDEAGGWTPYLSLEDAYKLDTVREALREGDLKRASELSERVYRLSPVEI